MKKYKKPKPNCSHLGMGQKWDASSPKSSTKRHTMKNMDVKENNLFAYHSHWAPGFLPTKM